MFCPEDDDEFATPSRETYKQLDRSLDYLEGLSWTYFDRRQRGTVRRLRRAVRAVERRSRREPGSVPASECLACWMRFAAADAATGLSPMTSTRRGLLVGIASDADPKVAIDGRRPAADAATWEAAVVAVAGERAFARYRIGAAVRNRRARTAARFLAEWLALVIRHR